MSAADLAQALRAEATKIIDARSELLDSDAERDARVVNDLSNAGELVRVLARLVEGKSVHQAFGAPGDFGYQTPIGAALYRYYSEAQS